MKINDIEFNIRESGQGVPFVWGHGLTSSMAGEDALDIFRWDDFSNKIRLIRYDARGHGQTAASYVPDHYHWRALADDMTAIADALHVDRYTAGGQSMGCTTAIYAALKVPHRIQRLVLVTPPTAWESRKSMSDMYRKMAKVGALLGGKLFAKLAYQRLRNDLPDCLAGVPEEKIGSMLEGLKTIDRKTLAVLYRGAALTDLPTKEAIGAIDIPALILAWEGDPGHPVEIAAELSRLLPRSELVVAKKYSDIEKWPRMMGAFIADPGSFTPD